jgi:hypothetical protein
VFSKTISIFLYLFILVLTLPARATPILKVKNNWAVVEKGIFVVGDKVIFYSKSGAKVGTGKVEKVGQKRAIITLVEGSAGIGDSALLEGEDPSESVSADYIPPDHGELRGWHFGVGMGYNMFSSADFSGASVSLPSASYSANSPITAQFSSAFGLVAELRRLDPHAWGWVTGLEYDFNRVFSSVNVPAKGINVVGSNSAQLQVGFLYGSAAYRWEKLYTFFGLNYDFVRFSAAGAGESASGSGGIGAQLGLGYCFVDWLAAEVGVTALNLNLSWAGDTSLGMTANVSYGSGYMRSVFFAAKAYY